MLTVSHFLIALLEFFLINWLGKHSISSGYYQISFVQTIEDAPLFNAVFRILAPSVFLVLTAVLWYALGLDVIVERYWVVTVFYFAIRWSFNLMMGRAPLLNWWKQSVTAAVAIGLSFIVSSELIVDRQALLPSARGLTDQLWIIILGFLYLTAGRVNWPQLGRSADERKRDYIRAKYRSFQTQFGVVISSHATGRAAEALSYAILIYESFNRPRAYQFVESRILFPIGWARTLGPMQVRTRQRLPERELVRLGVEVVDRALVAAFERMCRDAPAALTMYLRRDPEQGVELPFSSDFDISQVRFENVPSYYQDEIVRLAAGEYNIRSDYPGEVAGIFAFIRDSFYPELNPDRTAFPPPAV